MTDPTLSPYRVVDREGQGWYLTSSGYQASYGWNRGLATVTDLDALAAARGPLRPVLPVTDADQDVIETQLQQAGRKAVTTLAAALAGTYFTQLRVRGLNGSLIVAGREGSWESSCLITVAVIGVDLKPSRVDPAARDALTAIFTRWVTDPDRYTEVAENLASIVSGYADREHGPDGWKRIADQWLQPGGMAEDTFRETYRWLYSRSQYFDTGLL
jgi:hypothetical protein